MEGQFIDQLLKTLSESYPAIGSKDLAEKLGREENEIVQTLYNVKIEAGLFTISSGLDMNAKEYQPMPESINSRLADGGFTKLYRDARIESSAIAFKKVLDEEVEEGKLKNKVLIYCVIGIVILISVILALRYLKI